MEDTLTIHEDGRIVITGVMTGEEALHLLWEATRNVEAFIKRRALPATLEPLPPDDPRKRDFDNVGFSGNVDDIPF